MPILRLENLADISTECFSLHQGETFALMKFLPRLNFCPDETFTPMKTEALCQNIGKVF